MKNLTKALTIILATTLVSVPILAEMQESLGYIKQQEGLKEVYNNTYNKPSSSRPYNLRIKIVDKYGNILGVNTKWHGSTSCISPELLESSDHAADKVTYSVSRPYYYAEVVKTFNMDSANKCEEILLKPSKLINTVTGKIEGLSDVSVDNLYIAVKSPDISKQNQDVLLKVKADGTFKMDNLMDGAYTFSFVRLTEKDNYKSVCTVLSKEMPIAISKDTSIKLTFPEKISAADVVTYFSDIDRSNPMTYAQHTKSSQPPQLLVDMAAKIDSTMQGQSDLEKVKAIMKEMNDSSVSRQGTVRNHPMADIIKEGKIYYESCGDYANVFVSLARELGLPATYAQAVMLGQNYSEAAKYRNGTIQHADAHQNVEVYLPDENKWILVEPHFCDVILNYDPANPFVAYKGSDLNLPQDGVWYFYIKASNNNFNKPHEFVLKNIDVTVSYEAQAYDLKLDYNK